jgi:predicted Zn-dependent protease
MSAGGSAAHGSQIVNPGRLTADLENDICMSCHEAGDARVLKPGKTYQDFRPGTPLDNTFSVLMVPLKRDDPDNHDHVQHYFEMSMSKCFRATSGQLRCATCHNPHFEPTQEEAPAYFNQKCVGCHSRQTCRLPLEARQSTTPPDNCIRCHMERREQTITAHTSLTNHRILMRPDEPWPNEAFELTNSSLADLVHLNPVAGRSDSVPALSLLEAYREIVERHPEYSAAYQETLSKLERIDPDHSEVQEQLGQRDLVAGQPNEAVIHLRRAIQLRPNRALTFSYLSDALARRGNLDEAIAASQKAVSLEPYKAFYRKALIEQLIAGKQYDRAVAEMEHYMKLFPEDEFMRKMMEIAKRP